MKPRLLLNIIAVLVAWASHTWGHEARPAFLEIKETAPGRYSVLWRTPVLAGMRLPGVLNLFLNFPELLLAQAGCILLISRYLAFRLLEGTNPLAASPLQAATQPVSQRTGALDRLEPGE